MSNDFISSGINGVLESGIDLRLESYEEENYYIMQMCEFFNEESQFKAYLSGDRSFDVELDRDTPILEVMIRDSILQVIPYTEDIFEVFTLILGFIARRHQQIILDFRGKEKHKIEKPSDINHPDEDDDSDDYEWI